MNELNTPLEGQPAPKRLIPPQFKEQLIAEVVYQIRYLRVPLFVLALFLFCSKMISIWLLLLSGFFAFHALFPYLPASMRAKFELRWKDWTFKHEHESKFLKELKEGARLMKPFLFVALFFAAAPISVIVMTVHYIRRLFKREGVKQEAVSTLESGAVVLKQNIVKEQDEETSFFHSPAFALTTIGVVGLGIPVAAIMFFYSALGVDQVVNNTQLPIPVREPYGGDQLEPQNNAVAGRRFVMIGDQFVAQPEPQSNAVAGRRFVIGQRVLPPTRLPSTTTSVTVQHFAMYAYLMSLGWCFAVLFMRAYFTFPFNFYSTEYDIEVDREGVRKHQIKGWFAEFLWYFWPDYLPRFYDWSQIKRVEYVQGGFGRLSPLPAVIFSKRSIVYQVLNKLASATDGLVDKMGRTEFISFDNNPDTTNPASRISVRLWELSSDDKARLFYAIRTYSPNLYIAPQVQEKLIGSPVMKEARYTELWFDLLTSNQDRKRQDSLNSLDVLGGGKYTVVEKLGAGGQAAAFLAKTEDGDLVVLKEFILTSAETFGALVESATDFENESSTLSRLDHPKVVKFLDIFAEDRRAYIVLEYVPGVTLRQLVEASGPMAELQVVDLAIQMCDILGYLHEQSPSVVHRDFTPENLIKQEDDGLKIVDFSVASRTGPHKSGDCVGKHSYTPPEQFRSQASPQSDIYALGATLYYMLTGADPKPISTSDPRSVRTDISAELASVVSKATALELNDRYESVSWLRLDLEEFRLKHASAGPEEKSSDTVVLKLETESALNEESVTIKIPAKKKKLKSKPKKAKKQPVRGRR